MYPPISYHCSYHSALVEGGLHSIAAVQYNLSIESIGRGLMSRGVVRGVGLLIGVVLWTCVARAQQPELSVWLIPAENKAPNDMARGEDIRPQIDAFNNRLRQGHVRVLNTLPPLDAQLVAWNAEFAIPNWSVVAGQQRTIEALDRFGRERGVRVNIRFITWGEAFELIRNIPTNSAKLAPDVVQIGSTWTAFLAKQRLLASKPDAQNARDGWRDVLGQPAAALPYINDVRLLFYWKRLPSSDPSTREFRMNASSWESILDSLESQTDPGDTMAFPIGLTLNLIHDYAPLMWAGGGSFLKKGVLRTRLDLTSPEAQRVPRLLARARSHRVSSFPEATHEYVSSLFVNGNYRATLEPASFIDRWRKDFELRVPKGRSFWDYAGAKVPPVAFKGGSELVVLRTSRNVNTAYVLAQFLTTDPAYTGMLAESGQLPSMTSGYGIEMFIRALTGSQPGGESTEFAKAVQQAIDRGRKYDDLAQWPKDIENRDVLESFQRMWRRLGEGDLSSFQAAAAETEDLVNRRIDWLSALWFVVNESWPIAALLLVAFAGYSAWQYALRREERANRMVAVLLYAARSHELMIGRITRNFSDLIDDADPVQLGLFFDKVKGYTNHLASEAVPHIDRITTNLANEMDKLKTAPNQQMPMNEVLSEAFDGATVQFLTKFPNAIPEVHLVMPQAHRHCIVKTPWLAIVILQEWFCNCITDVFINDRADRTISAQLHEHRVEINSPGKLSPQQLKHLTEGIPPSATPDVGGSGLGLGLIYSLLKLGYGAVPRVVQDGAPGTRIELRFPMGRAEGITR